MPQNSPFLLHFSVFAQFFVSHAPVCGGAWRLGGRPVGRDGRFAAHGSRFFAAQWVHRAPANGLRCLRRRVCVWWIARPPTGRRSPLTPGCGFAAHMPFAFCPPCPAPDSRFPIADFYLRQLPAFKLSCVNCNPSRAILCGTYLIVKGGAALCKFATGLFEAAVSCCNFAQGIARILCRTFPERVGKTYRIVLFPYAAYRWKIAQVTPGTVAFYTGYSRPPAPL